MGSGEEVDALTDAHGDTGEEDCVVFSGVVGVGASEGEGDEAADKERAGCDMEATMVAGVEETTPENGEREEEEWRDCSSESDEGFRDVGNEEADVVC